MTDEAEKDEVNPRDDGECREAKFQLDLRRLEQRRAQEEHEQRHEKEDERVWVAPNMGAGDSHTRPLRT